MAKLRGSITAGEHLQQLEADPEFVRRRTEQDKIMAELTTRLNLAEAPLVKDLAKLGIRVKSVWDLVNTSSSDYYKAFPLLLEHLRRPYPDAIREGIARSLAVRQARPIVWRILVDEFRKTDVATNSRMKDGLAVALAGSSDDAVMQELIDLTNDKSHGSSRVLLLLGMKRSRRPDVKQAIVELASDPQLAKEIKSWRRKGL